MRAEIFKEYTNLPINRVYMDLIKSSITGLICIITEISIQDSKCTNNERITISSPPMEELQQVERISLDSKISQLVKRLS